MLARILPAERAKPGLGPTIRVCQGQGIAPCDMVSQRTHVPPQSWGCHLSPEASPGAQISIQNLEEQDSEAKKVLESQEQCSMRHAGSSPKVETLQFREATGPAHSLGHSLSLHWRSTGRHGLIFGHPWRPPGPALSQGLRDSPWVGSTGGEGPGQPGPPARGFQSPVLNEYMLINICLINK